MIMMRRLFSLAGLLALLAATAMAFDESQYPDSKENRLEQAKRVLEGTPIEETLAGIIDEAARVKGEETANDIRAAIARSDTSELTGAMQRAYATTFTAAELAFLADYANADIGKRVQKKMPSYVAKIHPAMKHFAQGIFQDVEARKKAEEAAGIAAPKKGKGKKGGGATPAEGIKVASEL